MKATNPVDRPARQLPALLVVVLLGALAACGDAGGDPTGATSPEPGATAPAATSPAAPPPATPPDAEVELIEVTIADGEIDPPPDRVIVAQGSTVRIVVTSDQPDELHLHHYDLAAEVGPDEPGVIVFVADQTGLFELETHHLGLVLLQLQVQ